MKHNRFIIQRIDSGKYLRPNLKDRYTSDIMKAGRWFTVASAEKWIEDLHGSDHTIIPIYSNDRRPELDMPISSESQTNSMRTDKKQIPNNGDEDLPF